MVDKFQELAAKLRSDHQARIGQAMMNLRYMGGNAEEIGREMDAVFDRELATAMRFVCDAENAECEAVLTGYANFIKRMAETGSQAHAVAYVELGDAIKEISARRAERAKPKAAELSTDTAQKG